MWRINLNDCTNSHINRHLHAFISALYLYFAIRLHLAGEFVEIKQIVRRLREEAAHENGTRVLQAERNACSPFATAL